ncbi:MAG: alpha-2-macroglobulin family protein [Bacteroidetes bacterium]|nr:alpha-2-macroglobulin family protein [Bacteroidota bacterium]
MIFRVVLFVVSVLVLASCSGDKVNITSRNFTDEVQREQNLSFTFDKPLMPDSLLTYNWDTTSYIKFTPSVRGKFRWNSPTELLFSPSKGFKPSTDYKGELSEIILRYADKKLKISDENVFAFHTPYLKLMDALPFWAKSTKNPSQVALQLRLNFTENVNPQELANLLHIQLDGKDAPFELPFSTVDKTIQVIIENPPSGTARLPVRVLVDKGLRCVESEFITKNPFELIFDAPSRDKIQIVQVSTGFEDEKQAIEILTTQSIDNSDIQPLVSVNPSVKFTAETMEYGLIVKGDFKIGTTYELTVSGKLKGIVGGEMQQDYKQYVQFGELRPTLAFTSQKAVYLTSKGDKNVGLKITNIPRVRVIITKIYENNILAFLRDGGGYSEDGYQEEYNNYSWLDTKNYGDEIVNKIVETKSLPKDNGRSLLNLNFDDKTMFKGIYLVKVTSEDEEYLNATKVVAISDIGLIAKSTDNEIVVFANSIISANPLSGVNIQLVSSNNQFVYKASTGTDGIARFPNIKQKAPGFHVEMLTAQMDKDYTYLHLNRTKVETSRFDVGGVRENPTGYQAFIYGDRNIYRPGETLHLSAIVRTMEWEPVVNIPVKLKLLMPNGKEYKTAKFTLGEQGSFETAINLPTTVVTGSYSAELYSANDILLNSTVISVEEFMPDRISVAVHTDKSDYKINEQVTVNAQVMNLFGPPASGRNYQMEYSLARKQFIAKNFKDYIFTIQTKNNTQFQKELREGKTDAEGKASQTFAIGQEYENLGLLASKVYTTVFDETGRPVNRLSTFDIITQSAFFGIKNFDNYVGLRSNLTIPLLAVDKNGNAQNGVQAKVQIIKFNWQNVIEKDYNYYRNVSQKQEQILIERTMTLSGSSTSLNFTPMLSGEYEVRIMKPGASGYVAQSFYAYGWGYTQSSSFEVNKEGQIDIETDKEKYNIGDKASILFKTPFAGKLLVTIERNKVLEYFYLETDKKSALLTLPIKEEYLPNVYVTATLFKPVDDGTMPLTVATGFQPIIVDKPSSRIPVSITVAEKSRSNTKQTITVRTGEPNVHLTIAVVDEGILQLKNYKTPDPHDFFYAKRALEVNSHNLYPFLFPEFSRKKSSTAGDGYDLNKRVNPFTTKRVNLISLWSGIIKTSGSEASYTIDIPQFSGDLRVMVVCYKNKSFGAAEKHIKVADPIVVSSALPRFASPNDTLVIPVTLTNTTSKTANATAKLSISGAMYVVGNYQQSVNISANSEANVTFRAVAKQEIGIADATVSVQALGETFTEKTSMSVRPVAGLLKTSGDGVVNSGQTQTVNLTVGYIPSSMDAKLIVSRSPLVQFTKNLTYLVQYPYGCVEQTVSSAFPQIYYFDLAKSIQDRSMQGANPAYNVQQAITKLGSMQVYNGGFGYWQGDESASWWGSAYAVHFLWEAKKGGFEVPSSTIDKAASYLFQEVKTRRTIQYNYRVNGGTVKSRPIIPQEVAYSLYVLALVGRADVSTMNYCKSNLTQLTDDSRYLLAGAFMLIGDQTSFKGLLPKSSFTDEQSVSITAGSFCSSIRDQGIALNTLLEVDPDNKQIPIMARHLSENMKHQRYLSTQENVFALLAFGKIAKRNFSANASATITVGGKTIGSAGENTFVTSKDIAGKQVSISANGGTMYYFWSLEGLSADGKFVQEDNFLRVRKEFLNRNGQQLSSTTFKQNDLVVVKIILSTIHNEQVFNVAITDMLPAGFEIENPRVGSVPELSWIKNNTKPEYLDIRDDRINIFTTASGKETAYYYLVRAVSKGSFMMGPVSADAMYNGEYHSYNGAGVVRIE